MLPLLLAHFQVQAPVQQKYVQSVAGADGTIQMQTSAARFTAPGKPDVWLIGAVHIGTKPYYESLQKLLDAQGGVLYEGVKGGTAPKGDATPVYKSLSDALGLEFQQVHIRYDRPNWKNCDLSWEEMDRLNKAANGGKKNMVDGVKGLLDPNGAGKMLTGFLATATPGMKEAIKILMVKASATDGLAMIDPAAAKIILDERNKHVVEALGPEIAASTKSIGVLYGAAHLPGIEAALVERYGYRLGERRWFTSATADPRKLDAAGKSMLEMMEKQLKPATKPAGTL